ncbi:MAG: tetratricopeptide repeat protein [Bacteroidota bacterium]
MHLKKFIPALLIFMASCADETKEKEAVAEAPTSVFDRAYNYAIDGDARTLQLTDSLIAAGAPEIEKAYYSKGIYLAKVGKAEEALTNYNKAIELRYNFLDAHLDKGILFYDLKRYADATKTFDRAIQIDPAVADFYYWLAKTQQALGDKANAKSSYLKAFGLDKEMMEAKDSADNL